LNQKGEVCGVLFGSGPGYTSGSYGGRVRRFLATVVPGGIPGNDGSASGLAQNGSSPDSPGVIRSPDSGALARAEMGPPRNPLPGDGAVPAWNPAPSAAPANIAPQTTALHSQAEPNNAAGFEPPLVPALPRDDSHPAMLDPPAREWSPGGDVDAKAAIDPRGIAHAGPAEQPLEPAPLPAAPLHSSLPPRGLSAGNVAGTGADLAEAPPDQLLGAMWRRFGGTTFYDQTRSVLAIIGCLAVLTQVWRFVNRPETPVIDD
jgi:hypothetical protein